MSEDKNQDKPHYLGHRERLRNKFISQNGDNLADYELLELILTLAIPRRDVKPLAKDLLAKFGSFSKVIAAELNELMSVSGVKENTAIAIKLIQSSCRRYLKADMSDRPIFENWDRLLDYCMASIAYDRVEQSRILYLDTKNTLIADELQQKGTVNHTSLYPREVVRRALELGATAIIMLHNHPSGDTTPSKADIDITRKISEACKVMGIVLHDHIIVGRGGSCSSLKTLNLV